MPQDGNNRKPNYFQFLLLLLIFLYVGYAVGGVGRSGMRISDVNGTADRILYHLKHPFQIPRTEITLQCMGLAAMGWMILFANHIANLRNYISGREYGSARWASTKEVNKKISNKKEQEKNKILSANVRMSVDDRKIMLNLNCLIIGGSGAGKTFFYLLPNAYQMYASYVFTDVKGELLRGLGGYLKEKGNYTIRVLNLIDMERSDHYNPFRYVHSEQDVIKLITNLIANTTKKNTTKGDPFWENAEIMLLQGIFLYVWMEYPKEGKAARFRGVMELLNMAEIPEEEGAQSELDLKMNLLDSKHPARIAYNKIRRGADDTVRSVIQSLNARLALLQNEQILNLLDDGEPHIEMKDIGMGVRGNTKKKTALFCIIPDNDTSYSFVIGLLYTQLFQELYYAADHASGGRLPIPVSFKLDEFANVPLPDGFCSLLSTMRGRGISCDIIIQNMAQIKELFKDQWETIPGNSDTLIYLGGNEASTHKYISEQLDKWTPDKRTTGENLGAHGSSSRNYDVFGRELMTPGEVRMLDNNKEIILIRGLPPVMDFKYQTADSKEFKEASKINGRDTGTPNHGGSVYLGSETSGADRSELATETLTSEQVEYYRQREKAGDPVRVTEMTAEQLLHLPLSGADITEEEISEFLKQKGLQESIRESLQQEAANEKAVQELKEDIRKSKNAENRKIQDPFILLQELIKKNDFDASQIREIEQGIEAGLEPEYIYEYASSGKDAAYMKATREFYQSLQKRMKQ